MTLDHRAVYGSGIAIYDSAPGSIRISEDWLVPDRASISPTVMPFAWKGSATLEYTSADFGDNLVARIVDAVEETLATHGTVLGDLIINVAILVQANAGPITQIGISNN